jgi:hypothetical protein
MPPKTYGPPGPGAKFKGGGWQISWDTGLVFVVFGLTYTNDSIQYMCFSPVRVFPDWLMFHDFVFVHLTLILTNKICHSILESCTLKMSILFMCLTPLFLPLFV